MPNSSRRKLGGHAYSSRRVGGGDAVGPDRDEQISMFFVDEEGTASSLT